MNNLKHHGVLGMKWGVRKVNPSTTKLKSYKSIADNSTNISREAKNASSTYYRAKKSKVKKMNLKNMTDKELRDRINRELMERQYNELLNPKSAIVDKGRDRVNTITDGTTSALAITSSALGIALAIKQLKG